MPSNEEWAMRLSGDDDEWNATPAADLNGGWESNAPPDGEYQVRVDRVELMEAKKHPYDPFLKWWLKVLGPRHEGSTLELLQGWKKAQNMKFLKAYLALCGVELASLSELPGRLKDLLDVKLNVKVETWDHEPRKYNVYFNSRITEGAPPPARAGRRQTVKDADVPF